MAQARNIPFGRPLIGDEERNAVLEVMSGPILVHGPRATQFEADFAACTGAPHAVSVSSCTAGMHLVWFARGLGPGDEVIVPAMTHTATAHAVALTGATPVFVDAERTTGNIDIAAIAAAITPRTRGIAIVHYLGMPVDMPRIMEIARRHDLFVMEDCALSLGATVDGTHTGLIGDCGVFSFYPVKHITTAEGGMIILRDGKLADALRLKKAFGVDRSHGERKVPGVYDVVELGFNYRMSEIHAAIGIAQLGKVPSFLAKRESNHRALTQALAGAAGIGLLGSSTNRLVSSHYCLPAMLAPGLAKKRPEIMAGLTARGVGTSVYYPQPVPRMTYYARKHGWRDGAFPNAEWLADSSIALTVGPHADADDMAYMGAALKSVLADIRA
jgi:dTDP-4-amino-4,6-dideoxygalactose transaminase